MSDNSLQFGPINAAAQISALTSALSHALATISELGRGDLFPHLVADIESDMDAFRVGKNPEPEAADRAVDGVKDFIAKYESRGAT
jgi:hypothetical protein